MTHLTSKEMKRWRWNGRLGVAVPSCNPNTGKAEAGTPQSQTILGCMEKVSQK